MEKRRGKGFRSADVIRKVETLLGKLAFGDFLYMQQPLLFLECLGILYFFAPGALYIEIYPRVVRIGFAFDVG